jgi:hypothetical protein
MAARTQTEYRATNQPISITSCRTCRQRRLQHLGVQDLTCSSGDSSLHGAQRTDLGQGNPEHRPLLLLGRSQLAHRVHAERSACWRVGVRTHTGATSWVQRMGSMFDTTLGTCRSTGQTIKQHCAWERVRGGGGGGGKQDQTLNKSCFSSR